MSLRAVFSKLFSFRPAAATLLKNRVPANTTSTALRPVSVVSRRELHDHPQGLDPTIHQQYMKLDIGDKVLATYIWIDGSGQVSVTQKGEGVSVVS